MADDVPAAGGIDIGDDILIARSRLVGEDVDHLVGIGVVVDSDSPGDLVAGVVGGEDRHIALRVGNGLGGVERDGAGALAGRLLGVPGLAVERHHGHVGEVQVVARGDAEGAAAERGPRDRRIDVVNGEIEADEGAGAEIVALDHIAEARVVEVAGVAVQRIGGIHEGVVLGDGVEADAEGIALGKAEVSRGLVHGVGLRAGVLPSALVRVVPAAENVVAGHRGVQDLAHVAGSTQLRDGEARRAGRTDHVVEDAAELGAAVDSQAVGGELFLDHIGVAAELRGHAVVIQGQIVGIHNAGIVLLLAAVELFGVGFGVEHGGIRPGAIVAQDGDAVRVRIAHALAVRGDALGVGEALDVSAVGTVAQSIRGDRDVDRDLRTAMCRDDIAARGRLRLPVDQLLGVLRGERVVAVHIACCEIEAAAVVLAAEIVEDGLDVGIVGSAVTVNVVSRRLRAGAVPDVADIGGKRRGEAGEVLAVDRLREEIGPQLKAQIGIGDVIERVAEAVLPEAAGIVAQLDLDLAVGSGAELGGHAGVVHHQHGGGGDGLADLRETRALLKDGQIEAAVLHRRRRRHQQALDDGARGVVRGQRAVRGGEVVIAQILRYDCRETRHMRRSHGGAAHELILVGAAVYIAVGVLIGAVYGVDAAAGRGDLRLHDERAGNAPGAEVADRGILARTAPAGGYRIRHLHGAGVIGDAAGGPARGVDLDRIGVSQRDGDHREFTLVVIQGHADRPALIVGHDQALGAVIDRIVALIREVDTAAVDDDDLVGEAHGTVDRAVVGLVARRVDIDVAIAPCDRGHRGALAAVGIEDVLTAVEDQRHAGVADVVGGGHTEAVDEGTGGTAGVPADVLGVELRGRSIGKSAGVARGDRDDHALVIRARELVEHILVVAVIGEAGIPGAEGEVRRVRVEQDRVLDGHHVIGVVGAAFLAEDLHDEQLGVRRHADGIDRSGCVIVARAALDVAVGRRDTRDVRAMLALLVFQMGDRGVPIDIVGGEGDLRIAVDAVGGAEAAGDVQLLPNSPDVVLRHEDDRRFAVLGALRVDLADRMVERVLVKGLVRRVKAGVDDGDAAARAGIAGGPGRRRSDHVSTGIGRVGVCGAVLLRKIEVLALDGGDAGERLDHDHLSKAQIRGNSVDRERQVPVHVERMADHGLDLGRHQILFAEQAVTVGDGCLVIGDAFLREARVQRGRRVQEDGHADDLVQIHLVHGGELFGVFLDQTELLDAERSRVVLFHRESLAVFALFVLFVEDGGLPFLELLLRTLIGQPGCKAGNAEREDHGGDKQEREQLFPLFAHRVPPSAARNRITRA